MTLSTLSRLDSFLVAIDANNFYHTLRAMDTHMDYKGMREIFENTQVHHLVNYYIGIPADKTEHHPIVRLVDWLQFNGYNIIGKPISTYTDSNNVQSRKANFDVEITMDIMDYVYHAHGNKGVVLFTGDGDFVPLLRKLARQNVLTMVISAREVSKQPISQALVRAAQYFVDIAKDPEFTEIMKPRAEADPLS